MVLVPLKPPADLGLVARVLWAVAAQPNRRQQPLPGDLAGDFDFWFDGGACRCDTDVNHFTLADGSQAWLSTSSPQLRGGVVLPGGEVVAIEQQRPAAGVTTCVVCGREIPDGATSVQTPAGPAHVGCA